MHSSITQVKLPENPTHLLLLCLLENCKRVYVSSGCASFCLRGEWEWNEKPKSLVCFFLMVRDNLKWILLLFLLILLTRTQAGKTKKSYTEDLAEVDHGQDLVFSQRAGGSMDSYSISHCFSGPTCFFYRHPRPPNLGTRIHQINKQFFFSFHV